MGVCTFPASGALGGVGPMLDCVLPCLLLHMHHRWGCHSGPGVGWCHGVMVSTPGPTSHRRQLPAVLARPGWHNTTASATPWATLRLPPPPSPHCRRPCHTSWAAMGSTTQPGPQVRSLCTKVPGPSVAALTHPLAALVPFPSAPPCPICPAQDVHYTGRSFHDL